MIGEIRVKKQRSLLKKQRQRLKYEIEIRELKLLVALHIRQAYKRRSKTRNKNIKCETVMKFDSKSAE